MTSQLQSPPTRIVSECCFTYAVGVLHLTQAELQKRHLHDCTTNNQFGLFPSIVHWCWC